MAQTLNEKTIKIPQTESERVNVKARKEAVIDGLNKMFQLDKQIDALVDRHVRPLRDEKSEIMRILREHYQMPARLVSSRYHSYKLERFAEEAGDSSTLDTIREMYEYLPIHGIVDMFDPKGKGFKEDERPKATPANLTAAKTAGIKASKTNGNMGDCPFAGIGKDSKKLRDKWLAGFNEHQKELAKALGKKERAEAKESAKNKSAETAEPAAPIPNEPPAPAAAK